MSNKVHVNDDGYIVRDDYNGDERKFGILAPGGEEINVRQIHVDSQVGMDLAEFFLTRRDEKAGIWRYLEWIAREDEYGLCGRTVRLLNERTFKSYWINEGVMSEDTFFIDDDGERAVARLFFKENPSRPWEDAKAGEVWELGTDHNDAESGKYVASDLTGRIAFIPVGHSRVSHIGVNATAIKSGHRIYPIGEEF